jgi:hypothetical protein
MVGVVKHKAAGLIDGQGACTGGGIGNLASVYGHCFGAKFVVAHA